jgi:hypothetical protein
MSVTTISLDQWIEASRREAGALEIHPCRAEEIHVARADTEEFDRIVQDNVAHELFWKEEKRSRSQDPHYQPTYFCEVKS